MLSQFTNLVAIVAATYLNTASPAPPQNLNFNRETNSVPEIQTILGVNTKNGPIRKSKALGVKLTAKSAIVIDRATGKVLFSKNPNQKLPEASLTKIMTAATVLDQIEKDETVIIGEAPRAVQPEGAHMRLSPGEKISTFNLLRGLLMGSANDAAVALGDFISGSENKFVELMNKKAESLGLKNTQFKNTHGLDAAGHYSSATDLAYLMRYDLDKKLFREIIHTSTFSFDSSVRTRYLGNTNKLLRDPYLNIIGGKTGFTDNAGHCLIEAAADKSGHEIITVVLNSQDAWRDSKNLIYWTWRNYQW